MQYNGRMKTKPLTFLLALTFMFLFTGSVFGDDFQDAMDAANKGDFKTAYKLFLPLAEQGNAKAQFIVATRHAAKQLAGKSFPDRPQ